MIKFTCGHYKSLSFGKFFYDLKCLFTGISKARIKVNVDAQNEVAFIPCFFYRYSLKIWHSVAFNKKIQSFGRANIALASCIHDIFGKISTKAIIAVYKARKSVFVFESYLH